MPANPPDQPRGNALRTSMRQEKRRSGNNDNYNYNYNYNYNNYSNGQANGRRLRRGQSPRSSRHSKRTRPITQHFVAAVGEFVGTVLFLWFAFAWHQTVAVQTTTPAANGLPTAETVLYVALGYGFSLLVNAWAFYRISGGLYNPAVVLGMVLTGNLPPIRGLVLVPAEILGGIVAAYLVDCMLPGPISVVQTTLAPIVSVTRGVFIEMFLTSLLLFTILMLAAEKSKVTFIAPLGIGLSLFVAELAGILYTGGSLNPARSFGPAVVANNFPTYHWIYWVGPALGACAAAGLYHFVKFFKYEEANPGQDSAGGEFVQESDA